MYKKSSIILEIFFIYWKFFYLFYLVVGLVWGGVDLELVLRGGLLRLMGACIMGGLN
jgi:hypothetical protein